MIMTAQKNVAMMVPLKYFSNFWRIPEMSLINCETNLILTWSASSVIAFTAVTNQGTTLVTTDTKLHIPIVTLLTQGNVKLLDQSKPGFKGTITWNKYQLKESIERQNQYLD